MAAAAGPTPPAAAPPAAAAPPHPAAPPPLQECSKPSIDRIEHFGASGEGTTVPMSGTLLVKDGNRYVARQQYLNNEWHVTEVLIGNTFNMKGIDLSTSKGFWLT